MIGQARTSQPMSGQTVSGQTVKVNPGDVIRARGNEVSVAKYRDVPLLTETRSDLAAQTSQTAVSANVPKTEVRMIPSPVPAQKAAQQAQPRNPLLAPLDLGYTPAPTQAYASLNDLDMAEAPAGGNAGQKGFAPVIFSLDTTDSPLLVTDFRAPGEAGREMPVRNANVFRPAGPRRPAEITEQESAGPVYPGDASTMRPPQDGGVYRTEVRLPSSAPGIGMTTDYLGPN